MNTDLPSGLTTPEVFSSMEQRGLCDGFLWPYEARRPANFTWADGEPAVRYETRKGGLYLRKGSYKLYGYEDERDFARAAMRGALSADSERGILTLGPLRGYPPSSRSVFLIAPDCPVKLQFPISAPSEEAGILAVLGKNFPQCKIFSTSNFLGGIHFPTDSFWESFRKSLNGPWRRDILFLMSVAFSATVFNIYGLSDPTGFLAGGGLGFIFVLLLLRFYQKVQAVERSYTSKH